MYVYTPTFIHAHMCEQGINFHCRQIIKFESMSWIISYIFCEVEFWWSYLSTNILYFSCQNHL